MKKNISNKEIIEGAKNWLASLSNAEWSKKLEEENYLNELDEDQNLEWLRIEKDFPLVPIYFGVSMIKDKRKFDWTFSGEYYKNTKIDIPDSYLEFFIELEAA